MRGELAKKKLKENDMTGKKTDLSMCRHMKPGLSQMNPFTHPVRSTKRGRKLSILTVFVLVFIAGNCNAGIFDYLKNEVVPTLTGARPLKIDPNRLSIVHKGKPILKFEGDNLYIKAGGVTFQTSKLRERMMEAGAIMNGNTAVLSKVAAEQLDKMAAKQLDKTFKKAQQDGDIVVYTNPPTDQDILPAANFKSASIGREITIYNQTPVTIRYALNDSAFELSSGEGHKHFETSGEFYLQFDDDLSEKFHIARYFMTGVTYEFLDENGLVKIIKVN
jgi:hypothetical protein